VKRAVILLPAALLTSCSPPVKFRVETDEPIQGGRLILNDRPVELMKSGDGTYWAEWDGSDASGRIEIHYVDGDVVKCPVGYVTHGMLDTQEFVVRRRSCEQQAS
jgi:hypothetical protein